MERKKILIFTGKFPAFGNDTDGGSILVNSLIKSLKEYCDLDILFTRTYNDNFKKIEGVKNVFFETYKERSSNKFERRLANYDQIFQCLNSLIENYDKVIIIHASKAFGIHRLAHNLINKIVLFPMYLSLSYERSNEIVPNEYKELEKKALMNAHMILTPSQSEKNDMVNILGITQGKIKVLPRGTSNLIERKFRQLTKNSINFLYIGSIKKQKNTLEAIKIIERLIKLGYEVFLHLAGGVQCQDTYNSCLEYIEQKGLERNIIFHGVLSQFELASLIEKCDINISTSNWETFGRGVFEGMAGGLPTIAYNKLECLHQYLLPNEGIMFANNSEEFLNCIMKLIVDKDYYSTMSRKAALSTEKLSELNESIMLRREIIDNKVLVVLGTRPEAIKLIPLIKGLIKENIPFDVLNTNQHSNLLDDVLTYNGIKPTYKLSIFGKYKDLETIENEMLNQMINIINPKDYKLVIVQGDTLSALVGAKFGGNYKIDVGHVEAGMRTFDLNNPWPEEGYRCQISRIARFHFCPSIIEIENLKEEGIIENIYLTGNTFIDYHLDEVREISPKNQVLVTLHRRENLPLLEDILNKIKIISRLREDLLFLIPTHPNPFIVEKTNNILSGLENVKIVNPLPPSDFYNELLASTIVISDSGGVQEECILNCKKMLVVRSKTERKYDFDFMIKVDPIEDDLVEAFVELIDKEIKEEKCYFYGDGHSGEKIARIIKEVL